jgi:hypothetical protein
MVDYIDFSYDFHIQNNVSYVKTDFGIGKILEITPFNNVASAPFSLDGLSLALFYGTVVITSKPYVTIVNGNPYNSTTAPPSTEPANLSEIRIHDATTYKFIFGQNYTLFREPGQEAYESKSTAVSDQSVSSGLQRFEWVFSDMESVLSDLFPRISSMQAAIDLDYTVSSFLYRVCYPKWDGSAIEHDPTYIAYLSVGTVPEMSLPLLFTIGIAAASTAALMSALFDLRRTRKITRYSRITPTESTPQNLR